MLSFECSIADEPDDLPAGTIGCIGEVILTQTGFVPTRELVQKQIDEARGRVQRDYYHTGVAYICTAFHLKPNEIDEFTVNEFMDYLAMAEIALGCDIGIPDEKKDQKAQYTEIPDPKTGQILRVPVASQHSPQSRVEIKNGR
jgi:hypothetical protein